MAMIMVVSIPNRRISTVMAVLDGAARKLEAFLATGRSLATGRNLEASLSNSPTGSIPRAALVEKEAFRRQRT